MFQSIDPRKLDKNIIDLIDPRGVILLAGEGEKANPMTVSWGHFGVMWNRPIFIVHVRPTRYTHSLMEEGEDFTLNVIGDDRTDVLEVSGRKSGRDINKIKELKLTLISSNHVKTPALEEAKLIFECRIIYKDTIKPEKFLDPSIAKLYPRKDWHTSYWGEILDVRERAPG